MKNKVDCSIYFKLFITFLKIGAFTFGGGYAMIPLIKKEAAEKNHWIDDKDILDIVAVSESTPGPIAINSATFIGYEVGGFMGAMCSTLGVVIPSFFIILAISMVLNQFENMRIIKYAFFGIRAGVLALIINAVISMYKVCPHNIFSYIIIASAFVAAAIFNMKIIFVIASCAVAGVAYTYIANTKRRQLK